MKLNYVGVDLAKNVFQLHGIDRHGQVVWRRRLRRGQWLKVLLETVESGCVIGMEACTGAHHWARTLQAKGFAVRLIAPQFVKPYVKSNKNDRNDAISIALDFGVCSSVLARSTDSWPDMDCGADLRLSSNDRYSCQFSALVWLRQPGDLAVRRGGRSSPRKRGLVTLRKQLSLVSPLSQ